MSDKIQSNIIKKKLYFIFWACLSIIITTIVLIIDITVITFQLKDYYLSTYGYTEYLMQNNYSLEAYRRLIEVSSSINVYERVEKDNFFAAEIWECDNCSNSKYPIWQTNASSISEMRNIILLKGILKKINSIFIYNDSLIVGVSFPIYSYKISNDKVFQQKKYTLTFYKKAFDFKLFNNGATFIEGFLVISLFTFMMLIAFIIIPISIIKNKVAINTEKNIETRTLDNIKNMIEHELVNQENILKFPYNFRESINAALHHNNVAQIILRKVKIENINPIEVLEEVWKNISCKNISLHCSINIKNKIKFDRSTLYLAFNTIIKNAVHESVCAKKIHVNFNQNLFLNFKNLILIEISNDGQSISKSIKKKIFNGYTNKKDGHGIGLKNLKEILRKNRSNLKIYSQDETCFSFKVKASEEKLILQDSLILNGNNSEEKANTNLITGKKPIVVIIEDNQFIWHGWKIKMTDANVLFFKTPDEFFCHIDEERMNGNKFLSTISAIISDFDFGNGINFINANLIGGIENEDEDFNGLIILCTGFNEEIQNKIPPWMKEKISLFFQKKPVSYNEILSMIK